MIHLSLFATSAAIFLTLEALHPLMASDTRNLNAANFAIASGDMLLARAAVNSNQPAGKAPKVNVDQNGVILKGYDPVAYFKQKRAVKGDPKYSSTYGGATYYFASASDKTDFDKSPAKYAPQYGGYCANSMTKRKLRDIDPNVFYINKGKLYVCSNSKAGQAFNSNLDANIKKADANWQFYQPPSNPGFRREFGS
ncbi:MAG: YHS domain-containing protein [Verrucomicrobia bacterium]|nr:YHS domain-containing protein [Verrucomicrobiota bacterium]